MTNQEEIPVIIDDRARMAATVAAVVSIVNFIFILFMCYLLQSMVVSHTISLQL